MTRLQLYGGAYSARSVIANAQRSINLYPELNRKDSPVGFTQYQRPGRRFISSPPAPGQGRGLFRASNGAVFAVVDQAVYYIGPDLTFSPIGNLLSPGDSQCSLTDNGITAFLVDGTPGGGWTIGLGSNAFNVITDPTGAFTGATQVATLDTFCLFNYPGTKNFGSTLSNTLAFDPLYIAGKSAYPDPLQALTVNRRELILFGAVKSEIWYDVGGAAFPFAILPGAYIEHGVLAPFSVASYDIETYFLSQDQEGDCMVLKIRGYDVSRVSNHALENTLQNLKLNGADLSKAIGFTYQINGHVFYALNLPLGNQTWVFDASLGDDPTAAWHQESFQGAAGPERMRDAGAVNAYGRNLSIDYQSGDLYQIDERLFVDQVAGVDTAIVCTRGFAHIDSAPVDGSPYPVNLDGKRVNISNFRLDFEVGTGVIPDQVVGLRWSRDRGQTFGNVILQDAGQPGEYLTQPLWTQEGIARDFVFEVTHQINGPAALQGAWCDIDILNT